MTPSGSDRVRMSQVEELLLLLGTVLKNRSIYPQHHPILEMSCAKLIEKVNDITTEENDAFSIAVVGGEFVYEKIPLTRIAATLMPLLELFHGRRIESITFHRGLEAHEVSAFLDLCLYSETTWARPDDVQGDLAAKKIKNIVLKRVLLVQEIFSGNTVTDEARELYQSLRVALTHFALSVYEMKNAAESLSVIRALADHMCTKIREDRFPIVSRLHTRRPLRDYAAHSINTAIVSFLICCDLGVDAELTRDLFLAALVHDIGMLDREPRFHDSVLLTSTEETVYTAHPIRGVRLTRSIDGIPNFAEVVIFEHHQHWNGGGFPRAVGGRKLHLASSIVGLASAYDMLMHRPEESLPEELAMRLVQMAGAELSPAIAASCLRAMGVYPPGSIVQLSTDEIGVVVEANPFDALRPKVKLLYQANHEPYDDEKCLDLTVRHHSSGQFLCSIVKSINPRALPKT